MIRRAAAALAVLATGAASAQPVSTPAGIGTGVISRVFTAQFDDTFTVEACSEVGEQLYSALRTRGLAG